MQVFISPEVLVSSAKADLTLQDSSKNTALHLACSKVCARSDLSVLSFVLSGAVWKYCYFEKTFKAIWEEYLLCDRCLFCVKGHETSALLILEKITDRNLINATNAALQTYVSAGRVFERWVLGVYLGHKEEYFSEFLFQIHWILTVNRYQELNQLGIEMVFCLYLKLSIFFFLVGEQDDK